MFNTSKYVSTFLSFVAKEEDNEQILLGLVMMEHVRRNNKVTSGIGLLILSGFISVHSSIYAVLYIHHQGIVVGDHPECVSVGRMTDVEIRITGNIYTRERLRQTTTACSTR